MKEYEDITGERFGRLIALGRVPRKNDKKDTTGNASVIAGILQM